MKNILYILLVFSLMLLQSCVQDHATDLNVGTCYDGVRNQNETEIDCGGFCGDCGLCTDGIKNGNETSVDCGGNCGSCTPTCTPTNNTARLTTYSPGYATYTSVSGMIATSTNTYNVNANASGYSMQLEFDGATVPADGAYGVVPYLGSLNTTGADVTAQFNFGGNSWSGSNGRVIVQTIAGKKVMTFCSIGLYNFMFSLSDDCTGKVTIP